MGKKLNVKRILEQIGFLHTTKPESTGTPAQVAPISQTTQAVQYFAKELPNRVVVNPEISMTVKQLKTVDITKAFPWPVYVMEVDKAQNQVILSRVMEC